MRPFRAGKRGLFIGTILIGLIAATFAPSLARADGPPMITASWSSTTSIDVEGQNFTPGGPVQIVVEDSDGTAIAGTTTTAKDATWCPVFVGTFGVDVAIPPPTPIDAVQVAVLDQATYQWSNVVILGPPDQSSVATTPAAWCIHP